MLHTEPFSPRGGGRAKVNPMWGQGLAATTITTWLWGAGGPQGGGGQGWSHRCCLWMECRCPDCGVPGRGAECAPAVFCFQS